MSEFAPKRLPPVEEILELKSKGYTYKQMIEKFREEGKATERISPNSLATKVKRYRQKQKRGRRLEAQGNRSDMEKPSEERIIEDKSIVKSEESVSKKPTQEPKKEDLRVHNPLPPRREVPKEREKNVSSSTEKCPDCGAEKWKWTARGADAGLWYCPECRKIWKDNT